MKLSLIIFLSLLIFTGTTKNHTSTEDFSKVFVPVNDEEEEGEEEASNEKIAVLHPVVHEINIDKDISEHQPEDSGGDNDALKLHNSLQSLREYLEMLNRKKNEEEPISKEEAVEDNELGPHYHTMYTNEPPMEMLPEELQDQENVGDNPPKDLYFQPIPISDKIGMAERNIEVGTGGGQRTQETVLLAVSSATLAVLLLLTVFCAAAVYYCSKPYQYLDDFSLTSSEKQALFCPSDSSSYTRTEDSSLLWNERKSSSETKHAGATSFSAYVDEISTFSDESARTAERDKTEAEQRGLAQYQEAAPAVPPPGEAVPASVPPPTQEAPPALVPAEGALPPAEAALPAPTPTEGPPPPSAEGTSPAPPSIEGAPPEPPPAERAPPPEAATAPAEQPPPV